LKRASRSLRGKPIHGTTSDTLDASGIDRCVIERLSLQQVLEVELPRTSRLALHVTLRVGS